MADVLNGNPVGSSCGTGFVISVHPMTYHLPNHHLVITKIHVPRVEITMLRKMLLAIDEINRSDASSTWKPFFCVS